MLGEPDKNGINFQAFSISRIYKLLSDFTKKVFKSLSFNVVNLILWLKFNSFKCSN